MSKVDSRVADGVFSTFGKFFLAASVVVLRAGCSRDTACVCKDLDLAVVVVFTLTLEFEIVVTGVAVFRWFTLGLLGTLECVRLSILFVVADLGDEQTFMPSLSISSSSVSMLSGPIPESWFSMSVINCGGFGGQSSGSSSPRPESKYGGS